MNFDIGTYLSVHCAVLDRVVVSDVFPDEIVADIIEDLLDETTGERRWVFTLEL